MVRRTYFKKALIVILALQLAFPCQSLAYNKSWDQGHQQCVPNEGKTAWGYYDYDGVFHGVASSKECCEILCKICPVYANTGRLQKTFTDLTVPGVGPSLTITRTYQSQDWATSLLGHGWMFNFGKKLIITRNKDGEKIVGVRQETGEKNFFREEPNGTLELLADYGVTYDFIKDSDDTYIIINRDGSIQHVNIDGKIISIIDKNGNQLLFEYDLVGCLSRITNASGNYVDFQLGPNGKIASISDNLGRTVNYIYDENGNLIASTDPLGYATQYVYDSQDRLIQIIDPRGNTVFTVTYDTHQPPRIATFTEKGETWTISYQSDHTIKTDSSGNSWTYYFNDVGIIEKVIDPLGNVTQQHHNKITSTSLDWEEDGNGNRITYTYDQYGNVTGKTDPLDDSWTYSYTASTNWMETETDPCGVVTKYEYDGNGNLTKIIRDFGGPLENTTAYIYDSSGNQTSVTNPLGNTTNYEYDANGNLTRITDPLGNVTTYTYDSLGNRLTETDALGNTTTYTYDLMNRLVSVTDALGNTTTYTYDGNGNLVSVQYPDGTATTFVYDAYNRLIQVTNPLGNSRTYTYDKNNNILTMTDGNGNVTAYQYDSLGRKIRITDALGIGNQTHFAYDASGNLISLTNAKGNTTTYAYDALGRVIQKVYPDGATYAYTYSAVGNKVTETDAVGNTTAFTYDRLNRLVTKTYQDGSTSNYTYDALNRMLTGLNTDSTLTYSYDALGRAIQSTLNGKTITYAYDAVGNRISMATPEGEVIQYTYNSVIQMSRMQLSDGRGIDYTYDSLNRIIGKDYSGGCYSTFAFDAAGRMTQLKHLKSDSSTIYEQTNTFDNVGNIISKTTGMGTTTYTYDAIYQLLSADHPVMTDETFTYDAVGNRLTSADHSNWSYNNRNQLTGYDGATFAYDGNGNSISKTDASGTTAYTYDFENRLRRIDFPGGGYATYKYDVYGRRIEKNMNGSITGYVYDRISLLAEYDSSETLVRNYFYGSGDINPSILYENNNIYYFYHDHLSTPQKVTDENGNTKWQALYTSFGETNIALENVVNNFRLPGQYYDINSSLYYNLQRYYNPYIGRYLTPDPINPKESTNLYVYVSNNPINFFDRTGLLRNRFCVAGRLHFKIGGKGKICFTWDNDGDFGFLFCAGGGVGVGAGGRLYYQVLPGDLTDGWSWWGNVVASAAAQLGPVGVGGGYGFKSVYDAWQYYQACEEMWPAILKLLEGFRVNAGVFGVEAGVSADAVGCIQYIW